MAFPIAAAVADKVIGGAEKVFNTAWGIHAYKKNIELANTAHQREVDDLIKAGINPIFSAGGSGAQTPAGLPTMFDGANDQGISKIATAKEQLRQLKAQNDNTEVDTNKKRGESEVNDAMRAKIDTEQRILQKEEENKSPLIQKQMELLDQQIESQKSSAALNSALSAKAEEEKQAVYNQNTKTNEAAKLREEISKNPKSGKIMQWFQMILDDIRSLK